MALGVFADRVRVVGHDLTYDGKSIRVTLVSLGRNGERDYKNHYTLELSPAETERFPIGAEFCVDYLRG
jgi:hypothetical protein